MLAAKRSRQPVVHSILPATGNPKPFSNLLGGGILSRGTPRSRSTEQNSNPLKNKCSQPSPMTVKPAFPKLQLNFRPAKKTRNAAKRNAESNASKAVKRERASV